MTGRSPAAQGRACGPSDLSRCASQPEALVPNAVIFLDIDGVVLDGPSLWKHGNRYLPPEKIALIREASERGHAHIVVSSTWRYSNETADMLRHAGLVLHPDWRTPRAEKTGSLYLAQTRGHEIYRWLARHPEVTSWAIIDDDSDMLMEQMGRFVQTEFEVGVEPWHVEALLTALSVRDSDGTATAAANGDLPVPQDCQARAESIAQKPSSPSGSSPHISEDLL